MQAKQKPAVKALFLLLPALPCIVRILCSITTEFHPDAAWELEFQTNVHVVIIRK